MSSPIFEIGPFIANAAIHETPYTIFEGFIEEFAAPTLLTGISTVALATFGGFIAREAVILSCNYLGTRLVLKLLDGYTLSRDLQETGAQILHTFPYIHIVALVIALAVAYYWPLVSDCIVAAVAILSGLTIDAYSLSVAYLHRNVITV